MNVTIIIVSYNSEKYLKQCIQSIFEKTTGIKYNIIVTDNASTDNSLKLIKEKFSNIRLIENKENAGFAKAVNQAVKETDSEFILLLNPDTILTNNAVKIFYDFMKNNESVASCGGALFDKEMKPAISYGFFPSLSQVFFEEYGLRKLFRKYYFKKLSPGCLLKDNQKEPFSVDYVSGANMFLRRKVFEMMNFLDEDFFMYYEETHLSYKFKRKGYLNMVVPDAKIIHLEGKSLEDVDLGKLKLMKKGEFLFFNKCYGSFFEIIAKIIYLEGCFIKLFFKLDKSQLKKFNIILYS